MDAFFTGLTKRQSMLLLTAVTFGGQEGLDCLAFLPDDEAELLRDRARHILAIPRDKRVPFLVQEIKRFLTRRADELRAAEPARIAKALAPERPGMQQLILRALPSAVAVQARALLRLPDVPLKREVKPELLAVIRWKFEERLAESAPRKPAFHITDLLTISGRELLFVCDALGCQSLAPYAGALPSADREAWLAKLSPDQRAIAGRIARSNPAQGVGSTAARSALDEAAAGLDPKRAVRRAGARIVARACLAQSAEFAARVIEEHRDDFGRLLTPIVSEERQRGRRPTGSDGGATASVVEQLEKLAAKGLVDRPLKVPPPPARSSSGNVPAASGGLPRANTGPALRPGSRMLQGTNSRVQSQPPPAISPRGGRKS